jgi:hypothetical protein
MKHFSDEAWLDFARHVISAEDTMRMQAHLDGGCQRCAEVAALWQTVTEMAGRWTDEAPAESVLNIVTSAFNVRKFEAKSIFGLLPAKLVFDSFAGAPVLPGIRAISSTARHVVYEAGPWTIDVRVESERDGRVSIAGQVLGDANIAFDALKAEVSLLRSGKVIGRSSTNEFGEFQFECDGAADLQLRVEIDGQQIISLSMPD